MTALRKSRLFLRALNFYGNFFLNYIDTDVLTTRWQKQVMFIISCSFLLFKSSKLPRLVTRLSKCVLWAFDIKYLAFSLNRNATTHKLICLGTLATLIPSPLPFYKSASLFILSTFLEIVFSDLTADAIG